MLAAIGKILTDVVSTSVTSFFSFKEKEAEKVIKLEEIESFKQKVSADLQIRLAEEVNRPDSELRKFMLDYEGKATEMPKAIQILRGSVRPVVTYWSLILISFLMFSASSGDAIAKNMEGIPDQLWYIFLAIFGFWFGGRAVEHAVNTHQAGKLKQKETEVSAMVQQTKEMTKQEEAKRELEAQKTQQILAKSGAISERAKSKKESWKEEEPLDFWGDLEFD